MTGARPYAGVAVAGVDDEAGLAAQRDAVGDDGGVLGLVGDDPR
jgi:hypothetical protein